MRKKIVAGNWKMNMTPSEAVALAETLKPLVATSEADVVFCVPAVDIVPVVNAVKGTNIEVGAENLYFEDKGAYTGEISADMILDAGAKYVVIGHSERREYFKETDEIVNKKVLKALEKGLTPILCCGESLTQREQGITIEWVRMQIKIALQGVSAEEAEKIVIAYEPIWAIGTGRTATAQEANNTIREIRQAVGELFPGHSEEIRIQYGGSMKPENASQLMGMSDIDGGLIGGASLKAGDFARVVNY